MIDSLFMMVSIHHTSVLENHIPERSILMWFIPQDATCLLIFLWKRNTYWKGEEMGSFKFFLRKFTEFVFPWFDYWSRTAVANVLQGVGESLMALFTTPWSVERVTFLCLAYFGEEDKRTIEALSSLSIVSRRGGGGGVGANKLYRNNDVWGW